METLTTIAQAVAVALATGGLEALGGAAGRSAVAATQQQVGAIRQRFLSACGPNGQVTLQAATQAHDEAAVGELATAVEALAARDETFRRQLREFSGDLESATSGGTVQLAEKISNFGRVDVSGDFNLNM